MLSTESVSAYLSQNNIIFINYQSSGVFVSHNIPLPIEEKMRCIKFYTPGNNNLERRQQQKLSDAQNLAQSWSGDHVQLPQIDLSATSGDCRLRHSLPPLNKPQVL